MKNGSTKLLLVGFDIIYLLNILGIFLKYLVGKKFYIDQSR